MQPLPIYRHEKRLTMNTSEYRYSPQWNPCFSDYMEIVLPILRKMFIEGNCFLLLSTLFSTVYVTGYFSIFAEFWFFLFKGVIFIIAGACISGCTVSCLPFHLTSRKYRNRNNRYRNTALKIDKHSAKQLPVEVQREDEKFSEYLMRINPCPCCGKRAE